VNRPGRSSLWSRLYHGQTDFDIVGRWKLWFGGSAVVIAIGLVSLIGNGLNLGIDFTGGTVWEVAAGDADVAEVAEGMADLGYQDAQVQEVTQNSEGSSTRFLRVEAAADADPAPATSEALDAARSGLSRLAADAPAAVAGDLRGLRDDLSGVTGPFAVAVPEPLVTLQAEIDALPGAVEAAADDDVPAVYRAAIDRMTPAVEDLVGLEAGERARLSQDVTDLLTRLTGTPETEVTIDTVGPSWGQQISEKAQNALVVFLVAITLFITLRFELKMAVATVVALFHDLIVVVGLYSLFGFPVTPATVIALLTMLGFSIYDGIVVFDRVDENTGLASGSKAKMTYSEMANLSLNQVLMRSLNTSITTLLPIASVLLVGALLLGASTLEEYGIALFLGLLSGAYSSLFIATPALALLKEREPRYRALRAELHARRAGGDGAGDDGVLNPVAPGSAPRPRRRGGR
jgi:preprotein translocase SecF subunit